MSVVMCGSRYINYGIIRLSWNKAMRGPIGYDFDQSKTVNITYTTEHLKHWYYYN